MKIVATQGPDRFLIQEEEGPTGPASVVVLVDRSQGAAWQLALGTAVARGPWEESPDPRPELARRLLSDYRPADLRPLDARR